MRLARCSRAHTTIPPPFSKKGTVAMFKAITPLLRALAARLRKIDEKVADFHPWHIESGHFGKSTYRNPRFLILRDQTLSGSAPSQE